MWGAFISCRLLSSVAASANSPMRADNSIASCAPNRLDATPRTTMPVGSAKPIVVGISPSAAARSCGATAVNGRVACVEPKRAWPIPATPKASNATVKSGV